MTHGTFISFDGIDGTGKSTQSAMFAEWIAKSGREIVTCRDPGTTALGERLREVVLHQAELDICGQSETLLYMAARAQLVHEVIEPSFKRRAIIIADRYLLANVAYQGYGGRLGPQWLWQIGSFATRQIQPDCVFLLDVPVEQALQRHSLNRDRLETRGADYFQRVRDGFLQEASRDPAHICLIDATRRIDDVQRSIRQAAERRLPHLFAEG